MTTSQLEYAEYLKSEHWMKLRRLVIDRDGRKCTRCPSRRMLQAHHTFYRPRWEDSLVDDLITLCRACHEKEHGIVPVGPITVPPILIGTIGALPAWITTRRELEQARSDRRISRMEFRSWRLLFQKPKKRPRRNPAARALRRFKERRAKSLKNSKSHGLNFHTRRNWVNRGNSSN